MPGNLFGGEINILIMEAFEWPPLQFFFSGFLHLNIFSPILLLMRPIVYGISVFSTSNGGSAIRHDLSS